MAAYKGLAHMQGFKVLDDANVQLPESLGSNMSELVAELQMLAGEGQNVGGGNNFRSE